MVCAMTCDFYAKNRLNCIDKWGLKILAVYAEGIANECIELCLVNHEEAEAPTQVPWTPQSADWRESQELDHHKVILIAYPKDGL